MVKYLSKNELKAVFQLKNKLLKMSPYVKLILYGSKARGDFDEESDVDILVIFPNLSSKIKHKIMDIATEIEIKYDVVFGLIIIDKDKLENSKIFKSSIFFKNIKKEGIVIWMNI